MRKIQDQYNSAVTQMVAQCEKSKWGDDDNDDGVCLQSGLHSKINQQGTLKGLHSPLTNTEHMSQAREC